MRTTMTCLFLALALTACGKKDGEGGGAASGGGEDGPLKTTPKDLWSDFNGGLKGAELMKKYRGEVSFTGTVKSVGQEESGKPVIMLDVDGKNMISIDYADPAPIKAKMPKAGDSLTVTCKIGGASGALMMALDCK
jgi:hypothetical protein